MDIEIRRRRNDIFMELKPCCVKLSQLALRDDGGAISSKELVDTASHLLKILQQRCRADLAFDEKLADYVFFPLSHVLKLCQKRLGRLAELATECVCVILKYGWKTIDIELGEQLLLLLTFFAGGGATLSLVSEELQAEAYRALAALFETLRKTPKGPASLVALSTIPALGHCLTTILDGVTDGPSPTIQLEALLSLKAFWLCIEDKQALCNFLPGTISSLTICLSPRTSAPRTRRALIAALDVLGRVIVTTLSDLSTRNIKDDATSAEHDGKARSLSKSWLITTESQIKLALANIVKLRNHDHQLVRKALSSTCIVILDECHNSLASCAPILVETAMVIESVRPQEEEDTGPETTLKDLASIHESISELIKSTTYNWVISLPRVMQSNEESAKQSAMRRLSKAQELLPRDSPSSGTLTVALGESLRNTVISLVELPTSPENVVDSSTNDVSEHGLLLDTRMVIVNQYRPILMPHKSQLQTRYQLDALIDSVGTPETQMKMATEMLDCLRHTSGNDLLSNYWLSFRLLQSASDTSTALESLLDQAVVSPKSLEPLWVDLYAYSVSFLSDPREDADWRIQAIGLEVVAYTANFSGESFRPDLVDTLYPIIQLLGSSNPSLKHHAVVTLNIISDSCGYCSASEMITDNVDYLVNAVSLKLNTFDISPQAPGVLLMMIRLSGPSVLPYLDDVVGSIFAALHNFHGYPILVESLFGVLREIVEESNRLQGLRLTTASKSVNRKKKPEGPNISEVLDIVQRRKTRKLAINQSMHEEFPREPWKRHSAFIDEVERRREGQEEERKICAEDNGMHKAPTGVYKMVQSIARLGQFYLTSASALLRQKLLDLICTACWSLCEDEEQFLPVVNEIWPVLIKRLYDKEPFVVIAAVRAVAATFNCAGDFMKSRVEVEWKDLMKLVRQVKTKAEAGEKGQHGRGIYSQNWQVWESFVSLLITTVEYVRIDDFMFDELLDILGDLLASREDVRTALMTVNADAVWLQEFKRGQDTDQRAPSLKGVAFASLDQART